MRTAFFFLLVLAFFLLITLHSTEAETWIINPANNHFYRLMDGKSWWVAEGNAIPFGGHLATINDRNEELWLEQKFGRGLWIGFNDMDADGKWEWVSKEPVTYKNWCPGRPKKKGGDLYIAVVRMGDTTYSHNCWIDVTGRNPTKGIIELSDPTAISKIIQNNFSTAIASKNSIAIAKALSFALSGFISEPMRSQQIKKAQEALSSLRHPPMIRIIVGPSVDLYVTDPMGRHIGRPAEGEIENGIPGATYTGPYVVPEEIIIPDPAWGSYNIVIIANGTGPYNLGVLRLGLDGLAIVERFSANVEKGQTFNYKLHFDRELTFSDQIENILDFINRSVKEKTLSGKGSGKSGKRNLSSLKRMIAAADLSIEDGFYESASRQLQEAYDRMDGQPRLPDLVEGSAAVTLASKIQNLMIHLKNSLK